MFTAGERQFILNLARRAIEHYFSAGDMPIVSSADLPSEKLRADGACFVTLTVGGKLRGCIGHTETMQPLYLDIMENAVAAATADPRFYPLAADEIEKIKIEVSVLSEPAPLKFDSPAELLIRLRVGRDGVILSQNGQTATYLPQVWKEIPDKEKFLSSLCEKAGLYPDAWKDKTTRVWTYIVEAIAEK